MSELRIGTRGSPLALAQAHETRERLMAAHGWPESAFEIIVIKTSGDRIVDRPLSEVGGKGLFTKEIEDALIANAIDLAVHSAKDMPTALPSGLGLSAFLPREDVRDAVLSTASQGLTDLPLGAAVGTSSLRRQAMVRRMRPDLKVVQFRGNVQTRLRKLSNGVADATVLAYAGLRRLGLTDHITALAPVEEMLPAVAQGAIAIETRLDDSRTRGLLTPIHDRATAEAVSAERAFLEVLDGSCRTPIAGLATIDGERLQFHGLVLRPDGSDCIEVRRKGAVVDARALGLDAGYEARERMPPDFMNV